MTVVGSDDENWPMMSRENQRHVDGGFGTVSAGMLVSVLSQSRHEAFQKLDILFRHCGINMNIFQDSASEIL